MAKKQTAGRDNLGDFAPKFAALNDDVLFGEVWSRESELSLRDRSMITIASLMTSGAFPQLKAHLQMGKQNGLTKDEVDHERLSSLQLPWIFPLCVEPSRSQKLKLCFFICLLSFWHKLFEGGC